MDLAQFHESKLQELDTAQNDHKRHTRSEPSIAAPVVMLMLPAGNTLLKQQQTQC